MLATARARAFLPAGVLAAMAAIVPAVAQAETRRVMAGRAAYDVSGFHEMWFGKDYRDLWTTEFEVPVLDLATFGGGLVPVRQVGNLQSVGLAMRGKDGRSYTFRTLDKDPTRILPARWRDSWPARVFQDQTVANHPGTAFVVPALAEAAGVPHTSPRVVFMPDSPALGEFRPTFGGKPGTIDEYPTPASGSQDGFLGASEIVSSPELWARWLKGDVAVDTARYLRNRMLDLVLGDWDRHNGQVRFLRGPAQPAWLPLPEDRDQAFSDFSGVMLGMARNTQPKLMKWDDDYSNMTGLLFQGAELDRWLLSGTDRAAFTRAAREVAAALTDAVIANAVKGLPPEWYALRGEQMTQDLKRRRDLLPAAADKFYEALAKQVDVRGTDGPDEVRLGRDQDGAVLVEIRATGGAEPWFRRRFLDSETGEIRLYLHGGADSLVTSGPRGGPRVRVSGGAGTDRLDDSGSGGTRFYDVSGEEVTRGRGTKVSTATWTPEYYKKDTLWLEKRDYGGIAPRQYLLWWEPDPGIVLSASKTFYRYGFRKQPYSQMHRVGLEYKIGRSAFGAFYDAEYRWSRPGFSTNLELWADGAKNYNFFGFGNETVDDGTTDYEAHQAQYYAFPALVTFSSPKRPFTFRIGPAIKYATDSSSDASFIGQTQPYGFGNFWQVGARASFEWDTRKKPGAAGPILVFSEDLVPKRTGLRLQLDGGIYPAALDVEETFGGVEGSLSGYWGATPWLTLAGRAGGRHVVGKHPWHESAFIGGSDNVRGYDRNRFAGDTSLYTNLEARIGLGVSGWFLPTRWGLLAIADGGRVWLEGETSETWRPAYGGGVYVQLLNLDMTFYGAIMKATHEERVKFYGDVGFAF